jgi:hypothetical protein
MEQHLTLVYNSNLVVIYELLYYDSNIYTKYICYLSNITMSILTTKYIMIMCFLMLEENTYIILLLRGEYE